MSRRTDYDGRTFASLQNSGSGEVGPATCFYYHQQDDMVWAEYSGGSILRGMLIARANADGNLDMRYQHINAAGELMTGVCQSALEILPDGRYRLHEKWQWTSGDRSAGESVIEEAKEEVK